MNSLQTTIAAVGGELFIVGGAVRDEALGLGEKLHQARVEAVKKLL